MVNGLFLKNIHHECLRSHSHLEGLAFKIERACLRDDLCRLVKSVVSVKVVRMVAYSLYSLEDFLLLETLEVHLYRLSVV